MAEINEDLVAMYWAEIYGMAFFAECGRRRPLLERQIWQTLYRVEERTALHIQRVVTPDFDEDRIALETKRGIAKAQNWKDVDWKDLVDLMIDWITPYQESYKATSRRNASPIFSLVSNHETALLNFWKAEQNDQEQSLTILEDFLQSHLLPKEEHNAVIGVLST